MNRALQIVSTGVVGACALMYFAAPVKGASAPRQEAAPTPAAVFKEKCALCHGEDGKGSDLGKNFNVKDLTSKDVQAESDETLKHVLTAGKGNMPGFGATLSGDMTDALVKYVRSFGAAPAKPAGK
jgi:mono/diheme cytochrome c family protein